MSIYFGESKHNSLCKQKGFWRRVIVIVVVLAIQFVCLLKHKLPLKPWVASGQEQLKEDLKVPPKGSAVPLSPVREWLDLLCSLSFDSRSSSISAVYIGSKSARVNELGQRAVSQSSCQCVAASSFPEGLKGSREGSASHRNTGGKIKETEGTENGEGEDRAQIWTHWMSRTARRAVIHRLRHPTRTDSGRAQFTYVTGAYAGQSLAFIATIPPWTLHRQHSLFVLSLCISIIFLIIFPTSARRQ